MRFLFEFLAMEVSDIGHGATRRGVFGRVLEAFARILGRFLEDSCEFIDRFSGIVAVLRRAMWWARAEFIHLCISILCDRFTIQSSSIHNGYYWSYACNDHHFPVVPHPVKPDDAILKLSKSDTTTTTTTTTTKAGLHLIISTFALLRSSLQLQLITRQLPQNEKSNGIFTFGRGPTYRRRSPACSTLKWRRRAD